MTNFIYNIQDELFHINMILPVGDFSTIKKLVDHIEAQGKQLRELNAAITKRNATIEKYEREKKELQTRIFLLGKKVNELNQGIRDSEDLTWKHKYDVLLQSSEQAIGALQKKCQEYKNSESDAITSTIETLIKTNKELEEKNKKLEHDYNELIKQRNGLYYENKKLERANLDLGDTIGLYVEEFKKIKEENKALKEVRRPWGDNAEIISAKTARIKELEEKNKTIEENFKKLERRRNELIIRVNELSVENKKLEAEKKIADDRWWEAEKALETEKQISNNKIRELDEHMTKCNNLERKCAVLRGKLISIGQLANKIDDVILSEE